MKGYHSIRCMAESGCTLMRMANDASTHSFCWLGNDGWIFHHNGCTAAFDLDLTGSYRLSPSPVGVSELAPFLNYLFITHEHDDHFHADTVRELIKTSDCRFVLPKSCVDKANSLDMPEHRRILAQPGLFMQLEGLEVLPVRALHGHLQGSVYSGANLADCGYIVTLGGKRLYQPGDTVLLHEHLEMKGIDILFVSPTEHNTHIRSSVAMIQAIDPAFIFPQHFATYPVDEENYFWTRGYPDELYDALPQAFSQRYFKLTQGDIFTI